MISPPCSVPAFYHENTPDFDDETTQAFDHETTPAFDDEATPVFDDEATPAFDLETTPPTSTTEPDELGDELEALDEPELELAAIAGGSALCSQCHELDCFVGVSLSHAQNQYDQASRRLR